jgi:hypothetical protein
VGHLRVLDLDMTIYLYRVSLEYLVQHATSRIYRTFQISCTKLQDIMSFYYIFYTNISPVISRYIKKRILIVSDIVQYVRWGGGQLLQTTFIVTLTSGKHIIITFWNTLNYAYWMVKFILTNNHRDAKKLCVLWYYTDFFLTVT